MNIKNVFWNTEETRLRAGWRILVIYVAILVVFLPLQMLLRKIFPTDWTRDFQKDILLTCFAIIASLVICYGRKYVDKRAVSTLGLKFDQYTWFDYFAGLGIGFFLVAIIVGIEIGFGWLKYNNEQPEWSVILSKSLYLYFFSGLIVGWWENLFFVSFLYLNIKDGLGAGYSLIINLVVFGIVHMMNPNAGLMAFIGIVLIHSYEIFGFLKTGTLWLILGIHSSWNFSQGFLGFPISGKTGIEVFSFTNETPHWFGGNEFGPESGTIIFLTTAIAYAAIVAYGKSRSGRVDRSIFSSRREA